MTPEALAALHAACFRDAPRPWTAAEFAALLGQETAVLNAEPGGFVLGRVVGPEAELLTLAVDAGMRRRGVGRRLLAAFEAGARARGARTLFLEVAADNAPARALYAGAGWEEAGLRRGYYRGRDGVPRDALVLRKDPDGAT